MAINKKNKRKMVATLAAMTIATSIGSQVVANTSDNWFKDPCFDFPSITNNQIVWDNSSWNKETFVSGLVKEGSNNMMEVRSTTKEGNLKLNMTGLKPNTKYTLSFDAKTTQPGKASIGISKYGSYDIFRDLTNNWQSYSIDFTTGSNMTSGIFIVWNKGAGVTTRFDNLKLVPFIEVDKVAPVISYSGDKNIELTQGDKLTMLNVTAWDNKDGSTNVTLNITKDGKAVSSVDTWQVGTYKLTYTAKDKANNQSTPLVINVKVNPKQTTTNKKNWFKDPSFDNATVTNNQLKWGSTWVGETFTTSITKFPGSTNNVMMIANDKATNDKPQGNKHFTIYGLDENTTYTVKFRAYTTGKASIGVDETWISGDLLKGSWKDYSLTFKTGQGESEANFRIWNKEKNVKTYIDDMELMVVPKEVNWFKSPGFDDVAVANNQFKWSDGSWNKETFTSGIVKEGNNNVMQIKSTSKEGNLKLKLTGLQPSTEYTLTMDGKSTGKAAIVINEHGGTETLNELGSGWTEQQIKFKTGPSSTSAMFIVWNRAGNVTTYIDNMKLMYEEMPEEEGSDNSGGTNSQLNPVNEVLSSNTTYYPMSDSNNTRKWKLSETFSDEFDGNTLNSRWTSKIPWVGRFPSYFVPNNVRVENGKMILTSNWGKMVKDNDGFVVDKGQMTQGFEAATAVTKQKTGYGYYEVKTRTAPISMTNSFWLIGDSKEVDVYEQLGRAKINHKPDAYPINTHDFINGWENDVPTPYVYHTGIDLTLDYHVYGFEWGKEWLKFYFDGELIHTIKNDKFHEPMEVRFDTETFKWNGYPNKEDFKYYTDPKTGENRFTGDFHVEYFRVWRTDTDQVEEEAPDVEIGKAKVANSVFGTPQAIGTNGIDPIWNKAETLKEFKLLSGGIEKMNAKITAKTMWDNNNLYVLADVEDKDVFMNYTNKHDGDCVDVYLDGGNEKKKDSYDSNDISLKLMPDGTVLNKPAGVEVSSKIQKGTGYTVQVKIPWSLLKTTPYGNKVIGFDVQLNEGHSKTGKREGFTAWNGNKELWKSMESSGDLKLIK